jgi:hypothetical protein
MRWVYLIRLHFASRRLRLLLDSWDARRVSRLRTWIVKTEIARADVKSIMKKLEK